MSPSCARQSASALFFLLTTLFLGCSGPVAAGVGTSATETTAASQSLPPPIKTEPADTKQLVKSLDLSKLPMPSGATLGDQTPTQMHVAVPQPVRAATAFYVDKLKALGWQLSPGPSAESISDDYADVSLCKDGFVVAVRAMTAKPKEAGVTIEHVGNLDTRTLPRVEGANDQYSAATSSLYFATMPVADATAKLRRLLTADGWQEYDRAFSAKAVRADAEDLLFRKKALSLSVSISKPATEPTKSAIQYGISALAYEMPAPADATKLELQDTRWTMMCEIPRSITATADYYIAVMKEIGFTTKPRPPVSGKEALFAFDSEGHDRIFIDLTASGEKATKVKYVGYTRRTLDEIAAAEAAAKAKEAENEKKFAADKAQRAKEFEERFKKVKLDYDATFTSRFSREKRDGSQFGLGEYHVDAEK